MTDKEKILAEIQKRIEFQKTCIKNDYRLNGRAEEEIIFEYQKLINFINSLSNEPISEKKCMYSKDNYTDEDRKVLCEDCKKKCEYSKQEEFVSNGLEEAIEDAMPDANWYIKENNDTTGEDAYNSIQMGNMFKAGANWQKEQFEKNRLAACDKQTDEEAEIESDFAMERD